MPKKEFIMISIWGILIILIMYFLPKYNNGIFRGSQDPEDRKYEKREQYNPLYRSGHLRKKRGKYDCFSEIKGFYAIQIGVLIYISIWSIYGMVKYFFDVTNFFLEIFLLGIWTPIMFLAIIMELYYDVIIRKVTKKERELKKEAKILIYKVIEILQSQEISSLKQYVSPDLYLKLEQNFYNKQNIQHYRIEKIKPIKEKEIWENDTEIWYEIRLRKSRFYFKYGNCIVGYWKFVNIENGWIVDEILSYEEYSKREEDKWIETEFGEEERKYLKMSKLDQRDDNMMR